MQIRYKHRYRLASCDVSFLSWEKSKVRLGEQQQQQQQQHVRTYKQAE